MTALLLALLPKIAPRTAPRERPSSLSDAELLAISLGSGRQGQNVVEIAHDLLAHAGDLRGLAESAEAELCACPVLGQLAPPSSKPPSSSAAG
jgi:DNA repair protein RadC